MIDFEKSEKLPKEKRYFNISIIWIFYFRSVIRLLYYLKIPHELVTLTSIALGLYSAWLFYDGSFLFAALALHLKDIFDASDGALARLTNRGHLIGRYLDTLGDFLSLTTVMIAIALFAYNSGSSVYLVFGGLAILSTFIQCSFFNYYQLKYVEVFGIDSLSSKTDETSRNVEAEFSNIWAKTFLKLMRFFYIIVFSWQDKLVEAIDKRLNRNIGLSDDQKYANKSLMVAQSALCFGTHIFIIIVAALISRPEYALIFISTIMNIYLLLLLYLRKRYYAKTANNSAQISDLTNGANE